jgi:hypothetical protein
MTNRWDLRYNDHGRNIDKIMWQEREQGKKKKKQVTETPNSIFDTRGAVRKTSRKQL